MAVRIVGSGASGLRCFQTGSFGYRWTLTYVQVLTPLYTDRPIPKSDFFCCYFPGFAGLGIWTFWNGKMRCNVQKQVLAVVNLLWTQIYKRTGWRYTAASVMIIKRISVIPHLISYNVSSYQTLSTELVALLLRIRKVQGSNLDQKFGYPDPYFYLFYSLFPDKCKGTDSR